MLHKNYYLLLCNLPIDFWETMCYTVSITIRIKIVVAPCSIETRRVSTADAPRRDKNVQHTSEVFSSEYQHSPDYWGECFREKIFFRYYYRFALVKTPTKSIFNSRLRLFYLRPSLNLNQFVNSSIFALPV